MSYRPEYRRCFYHQYGPSLLPISLNVLMTPLSSLLPDGYSTSRTCEMSLSNHSGINFRGLVYLVDEATKAKKPQAAQAAR